MLTIATFDKTQLTTLQQMWIWYSAYTAPVVPTGKMIAAFTDIQAKMTFTDIQAKMTFG